MGPPVFVMAFVYGRLWVTVPPESFSSAARYWVAGWISGPGPISVPC